MPWGTPEAGVRKAAHEADALQVLWHYGGQYDRGPRGIVLKVDGKALGEGRGLFDTGSRGSAGFGIRHPPPVVKGKAVGIDFAGQNAQLAAEHVRGILAEAKKKRAAAGWPGPSNQLFVRRWTGACLTTKRRAKSERGQASQETRTGRRQGRPVVPTVLYSTSRDLFFRLRFRARAALTRFFSPGFR